MARGKGSKGKQKAVVQQREPTPELETPQKVSPTETTSSIQTADLSYTEELYQKHGGYETYKETAKQLKRTEKKLREQGADYKVPKPSFSYF